LRPLKGLRGPGARDCGSPATVNTLLEKFDQGGGLCFAHFACKASIAGNERMEVVFFQYAGLAYSVARIPTNIVVAGY